MRSFEGIYEHLDKGTFFSYQKHIGCQKNRSGDEMVRKDSFSQPLYVVLQEHIERLIRDAGLNPGDPIPPERELCQKFQVSRSSLRKAIVHLVRQGKLTRVPGKGTFVAEAQIAVSHFPTGNVGFVVLFTALDRERSGLPGQSYENNQEKIPWIPFYFEVFQGVSEGVAENGLHLLFFTGYQDNPADLSRFKDFLEKVDGVIIGELNDKSLFPLLTRPNFPVVLLNPSVAFHPGKFDFFTIDNLAGAYQAVHHLTALGHREIGCINHPVHSNYPAQERLQGYKLALRKARIPYEEKKVQWGNWSMESGYEAMWKLLKENPTLTAVFVANDEMALGAMKAAQDRGLSIPEKMSVVGFDDSPLCSNAFVPLTTVKVYKKEMGRHAVYRIVQQLKSCNSLGLRVIFPANLVIRGSTKSPS
ncbi:MAG: GntR family transcriptional regulator [Candidatus Caldatribacteriaceae bacterium]